MTFIIVTWALMVTENVVLLLAGCAYLESVIFYDEEGDDV